MVRRSILRSSANEFSSNASIEAGRPMHKTVIGFSQSTVARASGLRSANVRYSPASGLVGATRISAAPWHIRAEQWPDHTDAQAPHTGSSSMNPTEHIGRAGLRNILGGGRHRGPPLVT